MNDGGRKKVLFFTHKDDSTTILSTDLTLDKLPTIGMDYMDASIFFHPCYWEPMITVWLSESIRQVLIRDKANWLYS